VAITSDGLRDAAGEVPYAGANQGGSTLKRCSVRRVVDGNFPLSVLVSVGDFLRPPVIVDPDPIPVARWGVAFNAHRCAFLVR
jgi:hypothetical protein